MSLVAYMRSLPAPVAVDLSGPQGTKDMLAGRVLFAELDCTACHAPTLGNVQGIYSDLLLHNMGQSLSDPAGSYGFDSSDSPKAPTAREWRTPPLWGYRDSGPYMHDGRAQNLEEAVALHEGQGIKSARKFFALTSREQSQVESFLKSLVAPAAAANPGVVLAAEMESRLEPHRSLASEALLRQRKEQDVARDELAMARGPKETPSRGGCQTCQSTNSHRRIAGKDGQNYGCTFVLPCDRPGGVGNRRGPAGRHSDQ